MRPVRGALVGGVWLALALVAGAQAQADPDPAAGVDGSLSSSDQAEQAGPAALGTTRTLDASGVVVSPFADLSLSAGDASAPLQDEALPRAVPTSPEKLPPGPPTAWP